MTAPAAPELLPDGFVRPARERRRGGRNALGAVRAVAVAVLALLAAAVTVAGLTGTWARAELLDTDRYLAAVGPLATDPQVREDVAAMVATAIVGNLGDGVPAAARPRVRTAVEAAATRFTASAAFTRLWTDLNRAGHEQLVRLLRGDERPVSGATVRDGRLRLDLTPAVEAVRAQVAPQLTAAGVAADALPRVALTIDVADTATLTRLQPWAGRLDLVAAWAPWAVLACVALATAVARDRLRALAAAAGAVAFGAAMVLLVAVLGTEYATTELEAAGATTGVGPAVVDRLAAPLRTSALWVLGGALVVVLLASAVRAVLRRRRTPDAAAAAPAAPPLTSPHGVPVVTSPHGVPVAPPTPATGVLRLPDTGADRPASPTTGPLPTRREARLTDPHGIGIRAPRRDAPPREQ